MLSLTARLLESMEKLTDVAMIGSFTTFSDDGTPTGAVSEIYSPPRIASKAPGAGLLQGDSMDLSTKDPDGKSWDFRDAGQRRKAIEKIKKDKPLLVIGSPMCAMFSRLQSLNRARMGEASFKKLF